VRYTDLLTYLLCSLRQSQTGKNVVVELAHRLLLSRNIVFFLRLVVFEFGACTGQTGIQRDGRARRVIRPRRWPHNMKHTRHSRAWWWPLIEVKTAVVWARGTWKCRQLASNYVRSLGQSGWMTSNNVWRWHRTVTPGEIAQENDCQTLSPAVEKRRINEWWAYLMFDDWACSCRGRRWLSLVVERIMHATNRTKNSVERDSLLKQKSQVLSACTPRSALVASAPRTYVSSYHKSTTYSHRQTSESNLIVIILCKPCFAWLLDMAHVITYSHFLRNDDHNFTHSY